MLCSAITVCLASSCADDTQPEEEVTVIDVNNVSQNNGGQNNGGQNNGGQNNGAGDAGPDGGFDINASCPPEARPVYVVEADVDNPTNQGKLVRFDADTRVFTEIGQLACPAGFDDTPFSMSVDREANAWVLYQSGNLFKVSTKDASCNATSFQPNQGGYSLFGMGFVLNNPMFEEETLYVAGGADVGLGQPRIGFLSFPDLTITDSAPINGWPEMSGTAAAELWAFFPNTEPPRVARVVPATGEEVETIPVDSITGQPNAWAFAHWGGRFYLFYKSQTDDSSRVFEVTRGGSVEEIVPATGRYIVGAGVSTCAPTLIL